MQSDFHVHLPYNRQLLDWCETQFGPPRCFRPEHGKWSIANGKWDWYMSQTWRRGEYEYIYVIFYNQDDYDRFTQSGLVTWALIAE